MSILDLFRRDKSPAPSRRARGVRVSRGYSGAALDNLTSGFNGSGKSANEEIKASLPKLRARSRQLHMDNDYVKKFSHMVKANVIGPNGIRLQARTKRPDGSDDTQDNQRIEEAFKDWSRPATASVTRRLSWLDIQNLAVETVARDGEALVIMEGGFNNRYNFALNVMECDYLNTDHNRKLANGNSIVMGIEVDSWGGPVAYHLRTKHPGDGTYTLSGNSYRRVNAKRVIHLYKTERAEQLRGVPWLHSAIRSLNMLGGYMEAELVASRIAASKMGFFRNSGTMEYTGEDTDAEGNYITEAVPGTFENIGDMEFIQYDPTHPTNAYESFIKGALRSISAGLNVAYEGLSNDREGVNYSSIRSGVLDERDQWRALQTWLIDNLHYPVYFAWLDYALTSQALQLPPHKVEKFRSVAWQPRGWAWVDPLKDASANAASIAMGVQTRTEIAASQGKDLTEIFEQLRAENQLAADMGININPDDGGSEGQSNETD